LATLKGNAGPFTLLIAALCIVVFIIMNIVGDQPVMLLLAWPYDPSLKFEL
ncbi:rhomboid family intramembrane serine protease GlpG, partial [Enterobacter hormaechei]|nr:rhomboid family intramembrane serine protease GlpG [Enterobacter hormaechei]